MKRLLKRIIGSERGQALPVVLALLALGGLTIVPTLNHATTSLDYNRNIQEGMYGVYAADAGVEKVLWCLSDNVSLPTQLTENINGMQVSMQTEVNGDYSICFGEFVQAAGHSNWLSVIGEKEWEYGDTYKYTITVTWTAEPGSPSIKITSIGARLPEGYGYQDNSAALFAENLSDEEPDEVQDAAGAWMLNWEMGTPLPQVSEGAPPETQTFYMDGEGDLEGDYVWVMANSQDIAEVGEISGALYIVTATAEKPGSSEVAAEIVADILMVNGEPYIVSWQVSN